MCFDTRMETLALPDGSIVKIADVKAVRVRKHFLSGKFYVAVELTSGSTRDLAEHLSRDAADVRQAELVKVIRRAWREIDPYQNGYETGRLDGRFEGRHEGFEEGRSEGYQTGWNSGFVEG
jgi:hypothetical protein